MSRQDESFIELANVTKNFQIDDGQFYQALRGISLTLRKGEFISIMGPSGSGKSTLMHIIGALDTVSTGSYFLKGKNISNYSPDELARIRNREIGFIFQSFNLLPRTTVFKNVERPMIYGGILKTERQIRVAKALELVGIAAKANNISNKISGGEAQRVAIARALIMNPSIILADEPTGNLDSANSRQIMMLLSDLHEKGSTVAVITHDKNVAEFAHRRISLVDGRIVSDRAYN